jgi:hypothetical protein
MVDHKEYFRNSIEEMYDYLNLCHEDGKMAF